MQNQQSILVKGQTFPLLDVPDFKLPLLPHQAYAADWIDSDSKSLIIQAPTGSGKTLAALSSVLRIASKNRKATATFLYPTNELIKNQVASMSKSLTELGLKPRVFGVSQYPGKEDYNIAIIEGTGEVLHALAFSNSGLGNTRFRTFGSILANLLAHTAWIKILATNPDSLYLVISAKYGSSAQILTEIADADIFVIDEFHAYYGVSLANLIYTLKMIDLLGRSKRFIFLSATPSVNLFNIVKKMFGEVNIVKLSDLATQQQRQSLNLNHNECGARKVSHDVRLSLLPARSIDNIEYLRNLVLQIVNKTNKDNETVPCVLILNSVLDAVSIARVLENSGLQVSQAHGLIPKHQRKIHGDVVVGTSAIELGIDFQAHSVIFEGKDASSFLQRFGRVGRHFEGNAIGFVPERILQNGLSSRFEREDFEKYVNDVLINNDNYAEFIESQVGMELLSAIILSIHQGLDKVNERELAKESKNKILDIGNLIRDSLQIPNMDLRLAMHRWLVKNLASKPAQRGGSHSVIVFLEPFNAAINIDIIDAYRKLDGIMELDTNSAIDLVDDNGVDKESKALLLYGISTGIKILKSSGILETKNNVELAVSTDSYGVKITNAGNPIVLVVNGQPETLTQTILTDSIYSISNHYYDWRFNPVKVYESANSYATIGANSIISNWLFQRA